MDMTISGYLTLLQDNTTSSMANEDNKRPIVKE